MPVALEPKALAGGPAPSLLSPTGIAQLRAHRARPTGDPFYTHATLLREQWLDIDNALVACRGSVHGRRAWISPAAA